MEKIETLLKNYPYATLLIAFSFLGSGGDYLYSHFTGFGERLLLISPGEIIRGLFLLVLVFMLLRGRLYINHFLFFVLIIFLCVSLVNDFTGDEIEVIERQFRLIFFVKFLFMILVTCLVMKIYQSNEMSPNQLMKYLLVWLFTFHVIPIILSSYQIFGYQEFSYRGVENRGILFAINATSIILISTYSFYAIPNSIAALLFSFLGFFACETVGTKSAAVAGLSIPVLVFVGGLAFRKIKSLKPIIVFMVLVIVFILYRDFFLQHQYIYISNYFEVYDRENRGLLYFLTSGRSGYFDTLDTFFKQSSFLEILVGSHMATYNEVDQLAMLTRHGIFGLVVYIIIILSIIKASLSIINKGWFEFQICVSMAAIVTHSLLGGHVMTNPVVSFPVAFVIGTALYLSQKNMEQSQSLAVKSLS